MQLDLQAQSFEMHIAHRTPRSSASLPPHNKKLVDVLFQLLFYLSRRHVIAISSCHYRSNVNDGEYASAMPDLINSKFVWTSKCSFCPDEPR